MAQLDQYLSCESYAGKPNAIQNGFTSFTLEEDGLFYFAMTAPDGSILLRSQGYTTEAGRDNGVDSVMRNRDTVDRYKVLQEENDPMWYVALKAGNHQEIARSCGYGSEEDATLAIARNFSNFDWTSYFAMHKEVDLAEQEGEISEIAANEQDVYLHCEGYVDQGTLDKFGFVRFKTGEKDYFSLMTLDGAVLLRSQGYSSEAARDNGIDSVLTNKENDARYRIVEDEADGHWYVVLRAGNHQEIARSCGYDSEETAKNGMAMCFSSYIWKTEEIVEPVVVEEVVETIVMEEVVEPIVVVETPVVEVEIVEEIIEEPTIVERRIIEEREGFASHFQTVKATEKAEAKTIQRNIRRIDIDEYLPCSNYKMQGEPDEEGFVSFQEGGKYYFALLSPEGEVVFRSESYHLAMSRDNGIRAVKRNRQSEANYSVEQDGDYWYVVLKAAGTGEEIARSCALDDEAAALAWRGSVWEWRSYTWTLVDTVEEVAIVEETVEPEIIVAPIVIAERTLDLTDFEESEVVEGEASTIEIISATTVAALAPVSFEIIEEFAEPDPVVEEIEEQVVAPIPVPIFVPEIEVVPEPIPEPKPEFIPQWKEKENVEPVAAYVPPVEPVVEETRRSFLWWLLPLLGLLLAFMLWKSCGGCTKPAPPTTKVTAPEPDTSMVEVAPVDTISKAAVPIEASSVACNCSRANGIFKPCDGTVKSLNRLGTNPEFGNMHGLNSEEVLAKLRRHAKRGPHHREFLDQTFRGMGYKSFDDATVEMFTEVQVPVGTVGQMGGGPLHKSTCTRLDASGKDLEAFRIKSLNGCDVHFMKTCGNHFFFCEK